MQEAKLAASVADTQAQILIVTANEEAYAAKRESASEIVNLRETPARVEADKAAALKAAATAAQEKATVQQALDAARKTAPNRRTASTAAASECRITRRGHHPAIQIRAGSGIAHQDYRVCNIGSGMDWGFCFWRRRPGL